MSNAAAYFDDLQSPPEPYKLQGCHKSEDDGSSDEKGKVKIRSQKLGKRSVYHMLNIYSFRRGATRVDHVGVQTRIHSRLNTLTRKSISASMKVVELRTGLILLDSNNTVVSNPSTLYRTVYLKIFKSNLKPLGKSSQ
jgi:hypothetical protein